MCLSSVTDSILSFVTFSGMGTLAVAVLSESVLFTKYAVSDSTDIWLISSLVMSTGTRTTAVEVLAGSAAEVERGVRGIGVVY